MAIPFTQYLMPDGCKRGISIEMPSEVEVKAQKILEAGYRFECEMLSDYKSVSFTITAPYGDEGSPIDIAYKLAPNGPEVPKAVEALIMEFKL